MNNKKKLIKFRKLNNKKSVFYIIDAILFSILMLAAITFIPVNSNSAQSSNSQPSFIAKDLINIFQELKLEEIDSSWIQNKISDGNITNLNNTVLEQIGEFWSTSKSELAYNFSREVISSIIPSYLGYGIWIDDELVYSTTSPPKNHIVSGRQIVSGLDKNKPLKGFVARAQATNIKNDDVVIISVSPEGAGWNGGANVITKYFELNNLTINSADLTLSVHADANNGGIQVDFNDGLCSFVRNDLNWVFPSGKGNIGEIDVTPCLLEGENKFKITLHNYGYNSHTHPGTNIKISVSKNSSLNTNSIHINKRFYFDNVESYEFGNWKAGVWASFPFYIPENAFDIDVNAQIVGKGIYDYGGNKKFHAWDYSYKKRRDYDYTFFLNDDYPLFTDNHPSSTAIYNYNYADLQSNLILGTNVVSVYFNNYVDTPWGETWSEIYSDPFNDPDGSSYIEVNYTIPSEVPYGVVEITDLVNYPQIDSATQIVNFSYPSEAILKGETFSHMTQRYSFLVYGWADTFNPPVNLFFETPGGRAVPTSIYIGKSHFELNPFSMNYVKLRDTNSNNRIIGNYSFLERSFYIPSSVSFKDVFSTEQEAVDDAKQRLNDSIGSFLSFDGVITNTNSITDVPTLWGPASVEIRIWD